MDYLVSYANNKNVGTAKVTVTGIGGYTGKVAKTFNIVPKATKLKKLKAGKKVTYQATYLKDTVKKTVKVKK